jgi:FdhE protein
LTDTDTNPSMPSTATVRVMSPEEIAAGAAGETPYFHWPQRTTLFAERAMRLRQLARGHAMGDFLSFMADLAQAQQARLNQPPSLPVPDAAALDRAAREGVPPLPATDWPRDAAWHGVLRALVTDLQARAPAGVQPTLTRLQLADADFLERQADALLHNVSAGLDMACAPLVAAALQVSWTHLVLEVQRLHSGNGQPFGRMDDEGLCPCCGSRPTASITRRIGSSPGQRYLHCSLCSMQWHVSRTKCPHCHAGTGLSFQSLDLAGADFDDSAGRAAQASIQAECCDACGHYLKMLHTERDAFIDPVADDLATVTLDLLVAETGKLRHGLNLMLLFADPPPERP